MKEILVWFLLPILFSGTVVWILSHTWVLPITRHYRHRSVEEMVKGPPSSVIPKLLLMGSLLLLGLAYS